MNGVFQKLPCPQLVKKFLEFYWTKKFSWPFWKNIPHSRHYPLSDQSSPRPRFISLCILLLSSQLRLGLPYSLFPSSLLHQKHVCASFYILYIVPKDLLPNGRNTPCRLSATAYSVYSHLPFISADLSLFHKVWTCRDVAGTHLSRNDTGYGCLTYRYT